MKFSGLILSVFFLMLFSSCDDLFLGPDPENTPENNFQILWEDFDKHYSRFEMKNVNWDSLYSVYRPQVNSGTSREQLFEIFSSMLSNLKDSHVRLETPWNYYVYQHDNFPQHFDMGIVESNYLEITNRYKIFTYGPLGDDLGYIHINTFFAGEDDYNFIDNIIQTFENYRGIVVDVRNNDGGNGINAETVAGRFSDEERLYAYSRFRNGPDHDDFTELFPHYISPGGDEQFNKPIALLTNRYTGSAAEDFVLMMKVFPYVTLMGDTTGGNIGGHPITRELPNGWIYRMSTGLNYSSEYVSYEGEGIPPDIAVTISEDDSLSGTDTILETAIRLLK